MRRTRPLPANWQALRSQILIRDGYICQIRGPWCTRKATDVDHIINAARGGTDQPDNLQAACAPCHNAKTAREAHAARPRRSRGPEPHPGLTPGG